MKHALVSVFLLAAAGCAGRAYEPPELPASHPASIAAEEAPLPAPSDALNTHEADEARSKTASGAASPMSAHGHEHSGMKHDPHHHEPPQ